MREPSCLKLASKLRDDVEPSGFGGSKKCGGEHRFHVARRLLPRRDVS